VTNTVTVGPRDALDVDEIVGERPVWLSGSRPAAPFECQVQLRAHGEVYPCTAAAGGDSADGDDDGDGDGDGDGTTVRVRLHAPARGVAKGQTAVLYDGDTVLGSATIAATGRVALV